MPTFRASFRTEQPSLSALAWLPQGLHGELSKSIIDLIKSISGLVRSTMRSKFAEFCLTLFATTLVTK